jgi:hypothetical protein
MSFYHAKYSDAEISKLLRIGAIHAARPINPPETEINKPNDESADHFSTDFEAAKQKLIETRSKIYLFENIGPGETLSVVKRVRLVAFDARETLFAQGDQGKEIFFILFGGADIFAALPDGQNEKIARVGAGSLIGAAAFINRRARDATCVCVESNTTAIRFEIDEDAVNETTAATFLRLYINIANALVKKIDAAAIINV